MKKLLIIIVAIVLAGCSIRAIEMESPDGNVYRYERCAKCWYNYWADLDQELRDEQIQKEKENKVVWHWGDPAGGASGGGGPDAGAGK